MNSSDEEQVKRLEAAGEKAYDEMYEAHSHSACGAYYSDAKECFYDAIKLAKEIGREDEAVRLEKRLDHIKSVYRSQMSY
jgi:hypothetical protein